MKSSISPPTMFLYFLEISLTALAVSRYFPCWRAQITCPHFAKGSRYSAVNVFMLWLLFMKTTFGVPRYRAPVSRLQLDVALNGGAPDSLINGTLPGSGPWMI